MEMEELIASIDGSLRLFTHANIIKVLPCRISDGYQRNRMITPIQNNVPFAR